VSRRDFNYDGKHNDDRRQLDESVFSSGLHIFELPQPRPMLRTGLGVSFCGGGRPFSLLQRDIQAAWLLGHRFTQSKKFMED
jgi:hypothetical protein